MKHHQARVLEHKEAGGGYRILTLEAPGIASRAKPGQFVHMRIPHLDGSVLRRPFSIYRADRKKLSILYKSVGRGTHSMKSIRKDDEVSLLGPLGNGFPLGRTKEVPVLVAGGYGVAPLVFLATRLRRKGIIFIGGAKACDILCVRDFKALGWDVRIATEDGSIGVKGLVTKILDEWLSPGCGAEGVVFYACGPEGLMKAVGERASYHGSRAWLSLDKHMGCGVGACLACVQKIKRNGAVSLLRVCREGPVFEASEIVWD